MRYLKRYNNFLILEEAELKYSKSASEEILKLFNDCVEKFKNLGNFDGQTGEKIDKENYLNKWIEELKIPTSDLLYDKFLIQLGSVILQKRSETDSKFDEEFLNSVKESINQKKLNVSLTEYLNKVYVTLLFIPFYEKSESSISFGSLGQFKVGYALDSKDSIAKYALNLNILDIPKIQDEINDTIRHELQHLTQSVNSLCLKVGEMISKKGEIDLKSISKDIENCYESAKKSTFGGGKTKTGLKQNDEVANYDSQTGKQTNLKKVLNIDITSEEGKKKAKKQQYLLDDKEYKPWISDKVDLYIKKWKNANQDDLEFYKMLYRLQNKYNLNESLSDEQQKKISLKKELNSKAKELDMSYNDLVKKIKSFNISEISKKLTEILIKDDDEIKIMKQYRKELPSDVLKLFNQKIKSLIEEN